MRAWLRASRGAAAFVLSIAAVAPAQQVQPDTAPLTEAQTAGVRRLKEMIGVLNTGDYATIRTYFEANSVDIRTDVPGVKPGACGAGSLPHAASLFPPNVRPAQDL